MDLKEVEFGELRVLTETLEDFEYDKRWGEDKLRDALTVYLEANPDKIPGGDAKGVAPTDTPTEKDKTKDDLVKIQSEYRGEISSSFGMLDFGTDGLLEVKPEVAEMLLELKGYDKC